MTASIRSSTPTIDSLVAVVTVSFREEWQSLWHGLDILRDGPEMPQEIGVSLNYAIHFSPAESSLTHDAARLMGVELARQLAREVAKTTGDLVLFPLVSEVRGDGLEQRVAFLATVRSARDAKPRRFEMAVMNR